jgi:N-acyl-L-homoserine lactone synthetase
VERGFLKGLAGLEFDEFDSRSRHVALLSRKSGEVLGTVRMVLSSPEHPAKSFPLQGACSVPLHHYMPIRSSVEVSRFAISKQRRCLASPALMRLGLVRGLVKLSAELGVTHWCAVTEPSLLRLLQMTSIYFHPIGPIIEYHGPRQPCYNSVGALLNQVRQERPELWSFLTDDGRFWPRRADRPSLAA